MNILTDSKIAGTVLNRIANNASKSLENKVEQPAKEKVSLKKCINLNRELIYVLKNQD